MANFFKRRRMLRNAKRIASSHDAWIGHETGRPHRKPTHDHLEQLVIGSLGLIAFTSILMFITVINNTDTVRCLSGHGKLSIAAQQRCDRALIHHG